MQIRRNVDIGEGHDFQKDCGHPTQTISENYKKETDGYFDFVRRQRGGRPRPSDAQKQGRVHAHNHQDAASDKNIFRFVSW